MSDLVDAESDLRRVESLIEVNRAADALALVTKVLGTSPDNPRAWCLAARAHGILARHREMLHAADQAIRYGPRSEWGYRLRSMALRHLDYPLASVEAAHISVRLAPLAWQSHVNLVEALLTLPDRELRRQAYQSARTAVRLGPDNVSPHLALGRVYASIGETGKARDCFARALAIDPDDAMARTNMAALALRRGRIAAAGEGFRSIAGENPDNKAYVGNVSVAAAHWLVRLADVGTIVFFVVLVIGASVPAPVSGPIVLGLTGCFVLGAIAAFARLPRAMRPLVGRSARYGSNPVVIGLVILGLAGATANGALGVDTVTGDIAPLLVIIAIMAVIRFRHRIERWLQPYVLRRRYRAYVLGERETSGTATDQPPSAG